MFQKHILNGKYRTLREVEDYWWRVEFQARGSPHIHALLWIKDAPDVSDIIDDQSKKEQMIQYLDDRIKTVVDDKVKAELEKKKEMQANVQSGDQNQLLHSSRILTPQELINSRTRKADLARVCMNFVQLNC